MTGRARTFKKVLGAPKVPNLPSDNDESDSDIAPTSKVINKFNVLDIEDAEAEAGVSSDEPEPVVQEKKKRKKKKKKSKVQSKESVSEDEQENSENLDEVERSVREVNRMLGEPGPSNDSPTAIRTTIDSDIPECLAVNRKYLDVRYEVKTRFGVESLKEFYPVPKVGERHWSRKTYLVQRKETWPRLNNLDLNMAIVEEVNGIKYFVFVHRREYKKAQQLFQLALKGYDDGSLLMTFPYHLDTLLLTSIQCSEGEQRQLAEDLLDRLLFAMENSFHPSFSLHSGKCRLTYSYQVNRIFHIAVLKYIKVVQSQACYRTALELCKMLLSIDPSDPLAVMTIIDSIALMGDQYEWLVQAVEEWDKQFRVLVLPNLAFSYALANYHVIGKKGGDKSIADDLLERALLMYPKQLLLLLEKCYSKRIREFQEEALFTTLTDYTTSRPLMEQMRLYAVRSTGAWSDDGHLEWLESVAARTLERFKTNFNYVDQFAFYRRLMYTETPLSVMRQYQLMSVADVYYVKDTKRPTDPFPPRTGVTDYPYERAQPGADLLRAPDTLAEMVAQLRIDNTHSSGDRENAGVVQSVFSFFNTLLRPGYGRDQ